MRSTLLMTALADAAETWSVWLLGPFCQQPLDPIFLSDQFWRVLFQRLEIGIDQIRHEARTPPKNKAVTFE
jgi:hypothetical protein